MCATAGSTGRGTRVVSARAQQVAAATVESVAGAVRAGRAGWSVLCDGAGPAALPGGGDVLAHRCCGTVGVLVDDGLGDPGVRGVGESDLLGVRVAAVLRGAHRFALDAAHDRASERVLGDVVDALVELDVRLGVALRIVVQLAEPIEPGAQLAAPCVVDVL